MRRMVSTAKPVSMNSSKGVKGVSITVWPREVDTEGRIPRVIVAGVVVSVAGIVSRFAGVNVRRTGAISRGGCFNTLSSRDGWWERLGRLSRRRARLGGESLFPQLGSVLNHSCDDRGGNPMILQVNDFFGPQAICDGSGFHISLDHF